MSKTSSAKRVALYARVSIDRQSTSNQLLELKETAERLEWAVVAEFVDRGISGAKGRKDRPQLDALLRGVARRDFGLVACWSVDRLGRSLVDLVALLQDLHSTGVDLYLYQQGINTTTPAGKALFQMMGVFAEFEREMIRDVSVRAWQGPSPRAPSPARPSDVRPCQNREAHSGAPRTRTWQS
ncbi:recombinase family protein [Caenimonas soli]|uniref:recombinase family protein n=1 Tax=Caenimonas soli TaxID=2735555 RepID=UPI001A9BC5EE|nr:recombinase family protein [Caenimonas soli]